MIFEGGAFVRAARSHESSGTSCEDVARVAIGDRKALAIVCDGCSSGYDSSLTAKCLAQSVVSIWEGGAVFGRELGKQAWDMTLKSLSGVGFNAKQSPSTLLMLELDASEGVCRAAFWGDGYCAKARQGSLDWMVRGESAGNMPAYPAYAFDEELWRQFEGQGGAGCWDAVLGNLLVESRELGRFWEGEISLAQGDVFLLSSDGLGAIEGVDPLEAAKCLLGAKGPGNFMQRRSRKAIDDWAKNGYLLGDDFGVAALRFNEEER